MPLPLAHAATALILFRLTSQILFSQLTKETIIKEEEEEEKVFIETILEICLLIGSITPDGIDKPLYWSRVCGCTRTYGHTLLFVFLSSYFLYLVSFSAQLGITWFLGTLSHLLVDRLFGFVPFFWPFQKFIYPSMLHTRKTKRFLYLCELLSLFLILHLVDVEELLCVMAILSPTLLKTLQVMSLCLQ